MYRYIFILHLACTERNAKFTFENTIIDSWFLSCYKFLLLISWFVLWIWFIQGFTDHCSTLRAKQMASNFWLLAPYYLISTVVLHIKFAFILQTLKSNLKMKSSKRRLKSHQTAQTIFLLKLDQLNARRKKLKWNIQRRVNSSSWKLYVNSLLMAYWHKPNIQF
jgi:uncharacterized membrane protein